MKEEELSKANSEIGRLSTALTKTSNELQAMSEKSHQLEGDLQYTQDKQVCHWRKYNQLNVNLQHTQVGA